jgi:hypothetical protein
LIRIHFPTRFSVLAAAGEGKARCGAGWFLFRIFIAAQKPVSNSDYFVMVAWLLRLSSQSSDIAIIPNIRLPPLF